MRRWPAVECVVVHRGPPAPLARCLAALRVLDYPRAGLRLTVAEERATPQAARLLRGLPGARQLAVGANNYCRANNLAVRRARAPFVALLNNDCEAAPDWLSRLVATLMLDPGLAGAMGKILFPSGRVHSAGHQDIGHGYVKDLGFREPDTVRFDLPGARESITHAACVYRRDAYLAAGGMDEAFVMYYDDVDLGFRLRKAGWRLAYVPSARALHDRRPETERAWADLFCDRNRLLFAARNHPRGIGRWFFRSRLVRKEAYHPSLYHIVPEVLARLAALQGRGEARRALAALSRVMARMRVPGPFRGRVLRRARAAAGLDKPALLVYDHALHFVGGGQRYALLLAKALEDRVRPAYLAHFRPPRRLWGLHGPGRGIPVRVVPIALGTGRTQVDPGIARERERNPFERVSRITREAPFFLNANMVPAVRPRSDVSFFLCHFPDQPKAAPFHVQDYDVLICNSRYTRAWIRRRWQLEPGALVYPPIAMAAPRRSKERIILSVARFESSGSKKQREMIRAFARLRRLEPAARRWRLVLAGGSVAGEPTAEALRAEALRHPGLPVEILPDLPSRALAGLYARSSIFWHLCGLGEKDPILREHFGMSAVEAMRHGCVPVVFDGGGLRESVRHGTDGFRVRSLSACVRATRRLLRDAPLRRRMALASRGRARAFGPARFRRQIRELLLPLIDGYLRPAPPDVDQVRSGAFEAACRRIMDIALRDRPEPGYVSAQQAEVLEMAAGLAPGAR